MLDNDAGHVLFASLADDRVVVAGRAIRVVVVGVVTRLDAAIGQSEAGELFLDRVRQGASLRMGTVVVRGGVRVPDLGTLRDRRARVEVDGDEGIRIRSDSHVDAAGEVSAEVLRGAGVRRAGHDHTHAVVTLEFFLQGQRYRKGQVLLTQAIGDRTGVGASVPGINGDGNAGSVGRRRKGHNGCANGQRQAGDECPPRGAHDYPSSC